jgi:tetratricopeptide (TPR) repeat protein
MKKIQLFVLLMVVGCTTKQPPADYNKISATVAERYAAIYKAEQGAERPLYCQKLYDDSLVKYKTEQYVAAVIMLKQVVQMKGCDEELSSRAQYNIGNNYANDQFKLDEAKKAYQKVVDNYPEDFKYVEYSKLKLASYLLSDQAEAAYKAGNFTEAIALREEVIQQKRCDKELAAKNQYLAGYIYHKKLNDMDKAKAAFNNVIAIHPKSEYATKAQNKLTLEEGRTKAISAVQATPDDYGLIDLNDMENTVASERENAFKKGSSEGKDEGLKEGEASGIDKVKTTPEAYGLFDSNDMENTVASERENAFKKGSSEGRAQGIEEGHASAIVTVKTTPYDYGLYTKADIKVHESKARELALEEGQLKGKRQGIKIVKTNPAMYGLTPFLPELPISQKGDKYRASTNNQWHYQPEWGWLWTNEEIFPYVYLAGTGGKTPGWYYLPEVSGKSRSFYSYAKEEWATFDNK